MYAPCSRALGIHLILLLVTCLLAHEGALSPKESATPWGLR
jgi:protein SCO1/2